MNRLYVIQYGSLEIRGLVSPSELPELVLQFYGGAEKRGAVPIYLKDGIFQASKGEVILRLTIGSNHPSIPSRMLFELLDEVMDQAFK